MLIRRLTEDDLEALWTFRLQSLKNDPEAFGSTPEATLAQGGKEWMLHRLRQGDQMFYLGAFEESLIGIVMFSREEGTKDQHKGVVTSLAVLPKKRGRGIGKALMQSLIAQAKQLGGVEQLELSVVTTSLAACRLYHSLGFVVYGTEPRALKLGEQYWDEDLMVLDLRSSETPQAPVRAGGL